MSIEEIEKGASARIELKDLPQKLTAMVVSTLWKDDSKGKHCLYVEFETSEITGEPARFTQKYAPMHLGELKDNKALKKAGGFKKGEIYNLESFTFHIGKPRMVPT